MKAAVIGSGLIGRSWAMVFARGGAEVRLWDRDPAQVEKALASIAQSLDDMAAAGLIADAAALRHRVAAAATLAEAVRDADHVQENIAESPAPKQALFAEVETLAPEHAVLASSTSAIMPSIIFGALKTRARCLVAHPMNPPHLAPIVELCGAAFTAAETVARARSFMGQCGMAPIEVKREIEGFILNRLQLAVLNEAFRLIAGGYVTAADLDRTVTEGLALRWSFMGPIETIDLNAPDGVDDYLARYGETIRRVGRSQAAAPEWPADIGGQLEAERRKAVPRDRLAEAQAWRDRRLMALARHKAEAAGKFSRPT
ncbi:MAG: 3-hydroxyacyl-CoA dehydrogenase [Hyphomicrobiales bacterium]